MTTTEQSSIPTRKAIELVDDYDVVLLDAFGVLVHSEAALPGARELIDHLRTTGREFFVVTNDASKQPTASAERFKRFGLEIELQQIITSGSLLLPYFESAGLVGARCMVLGPPDSTQYVRDAGGVVVEPSADETYDAYIVCDDAGYPFLDTMDTALSALFRQIDRGDEPALVLPNPDLLYPRGDSLFGFTSGAAAMLLEAALARRYPSRELGFTRLGKPYTPIFEEARRRSSSGSVLMIGDQLETDIAGALAAGIDAALLPGVSRWEESAQRAEVWPTYLLSSLV
jgi:HAD superfamily hydrolase (TIGR01450 family)